jgi:DNA gyrase/topoisomerase IV subunit B
MEEDISKKYVKYEHREHVLNKPNMYIGSTDVDPYDIWLISSDNTKVEKRKVDYIPALFKIFDEIVDNATDHYYRLKKLELANQVKDIKIEINKDTGIISVYNSGDGIEIIKHPSHDMYIPELVFGNLMTSTNFTDNNRVGVGTNGLGASLTNIFSEWFEIETVDYNRKLIYKQRFSDNMTIKTEPEIKKCVKKPYTLVTFKPDFKKFNLKALSEDMYEVFKKRTYDLCAVTDKDISIYFNKEKLDFKTFEHYTNLYLGSKSEHTRVFEKINDNWEIIASYNDFDGFEQISFVNGLNTIKGGKHVDYIVNQIIKKITELITKKSKNSIIKPQAIKDNLIIFIKCNIINPAFDSQSKETLTTPISKFGSKAEISDKFIDKLYKSGLGDQIIKICAINEEKTLKKTDGKKRDIIRGLPKLEDANWAGTHRSKECLLILCEGESAKSSALAGLAEVGRDKYGIFPLKGKVMNVKDVNIQKIADNDEISSLKKILGLETGKKYTKVDDLRYGGIMLLTDSDLDGSHIRSLVMNLFHSLWPSLFKEFKFIHCLQTPIIKIKKRDEVISFYTLTDFENWKEDNSQTCNTWDIKYYKGLGTSTDEEAKEWFRNMKTVTFTFTDKSDESLDLAFNKKRADDRKDWLSNYDRQNILDYTISEVPYEEFINKELIHFSNYDVARSIPNMIDGLKTSQRKIIYSCFKRNLTDKEIKVAQLAAYVAEQSSYHHGEVSLQGAIVNLAQDYVGSNNINLLQPNGQFGCLDPDTEVLMWNTSIKKAKDVKIGDQLIGDDGKVRNVINITSGIDLMYEIQIDNFKSFKVNSQHILTVKHNNKIYDIKLQDYLKLQDKEHVYCVQNTSCINWPAQITPYDPYMFGKMLNKYDINDKSERLVFLKNDKNTRLQVLAGIFDTNEDVHIENNTLVIDLYHNLEYVNYLIKSLGLVTQIEEDSIIIDTPNYSNFTVKELSKDKFCGWSVDGNERFLLGDFTITHNSRLHNGKDSAQPRYIFTLLTNIATSLFKKLDNCVLKYLEDDGQQIEPDYYIPILPMILVNGAMGIGTGFSTSIPCYNPLDITRLIKKMLAGEHVSVEDDDIMPYYRGFTGTIKKINNKYYCIGKFNKVNQSKIEVTELPIGYATFDFKADLEDHLDKLQDFKRYENYSSGNKVHFILHFANVDDYLKIETNGFTKFENTFKLVTTKGLATTNMYAFNSSCQITKYETPFDIINEFFDVRLEYYRKRKQYIINKLQYDADLMANKMRFIKEVVSEQLLVHKLKKSELEDYLDTNNYKKHEDCYDYITRIPVYNLTIDKVTELENDIAKSLLDIEDLNNKKEQDMWIDELNEFEKVYQKFLDTKLLAPKTKTKKK